MKGIGPVCEDCCHVRRDSGLMPNRSSVSPPRLYNAKFLGCKMAAESVDQVQQVRQWQR